MEATGIRDRISGCEVCKESAPAVFDVERQYGSKVNFVMLNIDNTKWGGEMDQYGVDGIPHIVFLDKEGASEGQVVGKGLASRPLSAALVHARSLHFIEVSLDSRRLEVELMTFRPQKKKVHTKRERGCFSGGEENKKLSRRLQKRKGVHEFTRACTRPWPWASFPSRCWRYGRSTSFSTR